MLMNVVASAILFLFIGPFNHVRTRETGTTGREALVFDHCVVCRKFLRENGVGRSESE